MNGQYFKIKYIRLLAKIIGIATLIYFVYSSSIASVAFEEHKNVFDFGDIMQGQRLSDCHSFSLVNHGDKSELINDILPSCGCVTLSISDKQTLPAHILPGRKMTVNATVDLMRVPIGKFDKSIVVIAEDKSISLIYHLTGNLESPISISTHNIDFGRVTYGETVARSVKIDPIKPRIDYLKDVQVFSSDPDIAPELKSIIDSKGAVRSIFLNITLNKKPYIGLISGNVTIGYRNRNDDIVVLDNPISIKGEVIGKVSASPLSLSFVSKVGEPPPSQYVIMKGISESDMRKVQLVSGSSLVISKVTRNGICVSLPRTANRGTLQTQILIFTPSGEQVRIPLYSAVN
jgi:hypothetical protein